MSNKETFESMKKELESIHSLNDRLASNCCEFVNKLSAHILKHGIAYSKRVNQIEETLALLRNQLIALEDGARDDATEAFAEYMNDMDN